MQKYDCFVSGVSLPSGKGSPHRLIRSSRSQLLPLGVAATKPELPPPMTQRKHLHLPSLDVVHNGRWPAPNYMRFSLGYKGFHEFKGNCEERSLCRKTARLPMCLCRNKRTSCVMTLLGSKPRAEFSPVQ